MLSVYSNFFSVNSFISPAENRCHILFFDLFCDFAILVLTFLAT